MIQVCVECASSGISQTIYEQTKVCPCCQTVTPLVMDSRCWSESQEEFRARAFATIGAHQAALVEAAPAEVETPVKVRCAHYAQIRTFFSVARELGFDTGKASQDRWRGAIGMLLGRRVMSRSELTGAEWGFATNALRMGKLFI